MFNHSKTGTLRLYLIFGGYFVTAAAILVVFFISMISCDKDTVSSGDAAASYPGQYSSSLDPGANRPPYAAEFDPAPGSCGVRADSKVSLHIKDNAPGVNIYSVKMIVQGAEVNPVITGEKTDYKLTYTSPQKFESGEKIAVQVSACDLALPPLGMIYNYTFEVGLNTPPMMDVPGTITVFQNELMEFIIKPHDEDGDNLIYSAAGLPEGAGFDTDNLEFSWIPEETGVYNICFIVSDGKEEDTKTVRIIVKPERVLPLNVIFYGEHDSAVQDRILEVRPEYLTVNTAHGLWGEAFGYNTPWLIQDVSKYRQAGIKVIGYLTSGYEGTGSGSGIDKYWYSLEMNKKLIKNMAELDHVDGVFIDECSGFPDAEGKKYLKELVDYAHSVGLVVWGNAGQHEFDPWFFTGGGFNFLHSAEQWQSQELSNVQKAWGSRISITGYREDYTVDDAVRLTLDAWSKGLAYPYICNTEYETLPEWFEEYGRRLRISGKLP